MMLNICSEKMCTRAIVEHFEVPKSILYGTAEKQ